MTPTLASMVLSGRSPLTATAATASATAAAAAAAAAASGPAPSVVAPTLTPGAAAIAAAAARLGLRIGDPLPVADLTDVLIPRSMSAAELVPAAPLLPNIGDQGDSAEARI
jgi:hypothetical protein